MSNFIDSIKSSNEKLSGYIEPKEMKNDAARFLSVGPNKASSKIDWELFYSTFLMAYIGRCFKYSSFDEWKTKLKSELINERKYRDIINVIDEIYLSEESIKYLTPLGFALPQSEKLISGKTKTLFKQFESMLDITRVTNKITFNIDSNFLEYIILENLEQSFENIGSRKVSDPYLPFLAKLFLQDFDYLFSNQKNFMREFKRLLKLYNFIYISQLSLNLARSPLSKPSSQKLFFILDIEKASKERVEPGRFGYYSLFNDSGSCWKLFPYLTYLNLISNKYEDNNVPSLWWLAMSYGDDKEAVLELSRMNNSLSKLFENDLERECDDDSLMDELKHGLKIQYSTFSKKNTKSTRYSANDKVLKSIRDEYGAEFIKFRGAAGTFLELKADVILLLTNLIIGNSKFKLIDEIVEGMQERGIWLDVQSKSALVEFYESIGNAEKLSDSGDAVYVKSTF